MQESRQSVRKYGFLGLLALAAALSFQNCGGNDPLSNPLYSRDTMPSCIGPACQRDTNYINVYIANPDPIIVKNGTQAFDMSGYCDSAGFPQTKIYAELRSAAAGNNIAPYLTGAQCDSNGRFRVLITLPPTFSSGTSSSVILTYRAVDEDGSEYDHPMKSNTREVTLLMTP